LVGRVLRLVGAAFALSNEARALLEAVQNQPYEFVGTDGTRFPKLDGLYVNHHYRVIQGKNGEDLHEVLTSRERGKIYRALRKRLLAEDRDRRARRQQEYRDKLINVLKSGPVPMVSPPLIVPAAEPVNDI